MSARTTRTKPDTGSLAADGGFVAGTLVTLAEQAVCCTPDSCGAAATAAPESGRGGQPTAVTHPDLAPLVAVQLESGEGPIPQAVRTGSPAGSDDLLADRRWPEYRATALEAGIRSTVTLPVKRDEMAVTLTICAFRPGLLTHGPRRTAELLGGLAAQTLAHDRRYEQALTEVDQLDTALRTRPVIDQACGILMHILGCDADVSLQLLRRLSQQTNSKVSDLADGVVRTRGRGIETELERLSTGEGGPAGGA